MRFIREDVTKCGNHIVLFEYKGKRYVERFTKEQKEELKDFINELKRSEHNV